MFCQPYNDWYVFLLTMFPRWTLLHRSGPVKNIYFTCCCQMGQSCSIPSMIMFLAAFSRTIALEGLDKEIPRVLL